MECSVGCATAASRRQARAGGIFLREIYFVLLITKAVTKTFCARKSVMRAK